MVLNTQEWLAIFNPKALEGRAGKNQKLIFKALDDLKISYKIIETTSPGDAEKIAFEAISNGQTKILGIGGDAIAHEIVNAIFTQTKFPSSDISFGFIPAGKYNNWAKTLGIPEDYEEAAKNIKLGNYFFQDVGVLRFFENGEQKNIRFFINVASIGFNGYVASILDHKSKNGKKLSTLAKSMTIRKCIKKYESPEFHMMLDETEKVSKHYSIHIGIGQYFDKNLHVLPTAVPDDGFLEMITFEKLAEQRNLKNQDHFYSSENAKKITSIKSAIIDADTEVYIEADGIPQGKTPVSISVIDRGLKIVSTLKNRQI